MKKITLLITTILVLNCINAFAQLDAPSKLPSERLESEFFTDDIGNYTAPAQQVTLVNNAGDDSMLLQTTLNSLSNSGGGVITIPSGTWEFGEIKLRSNVHLVFDPGAIIVPVLSTLPNKSIFKIGLTGQNIQNVSIRASSGQFTIDMSGFSYNEVRITPFNVKNVENFMVADCFVKDKRTIHATMNCGVSKTNNVWSGAKLGLVKNITVEDAHGGYGAIQVRVGDRLHFKNIISLGGGSTLRIETDAHESSNKMAPLSVTTISEISAYNIKCKNGNSAVMIQPWGATNGWFDVEKIEAESCLAAVRIDRAFVDINAADVGSYDADSRILDVTSIYGTTAHIKDGSFSAVPCPLRSLISNTPLVGMDDRFFEGPMVAPVLYRASSNDPTDNDPRYYRVNIPSENELALKATGFPANSLIVRRWSDVTTSCSGYTFNAATGLSVSPMVLNIDENETMSLTQIVAPTNATNKGVSWTSNDETIATVNQWGDVTGKAVGTTTITINTTDGNFIANVTVNVSAILSVDAFNENTASVYPNPHSGKENLTIELPNFSNDTSISIYNTQGKLVLNKSFEGEQLKKISISAAQLSLNSGIYFISIKNNNANFISKLIVN